MNEHMKSRILSLSAILWAIALAGCVTPPDGRTVREPRYVSLPYGLDAVERRFLPELAAALEAHGYQPVKTGGQRYGLDFAIEEGPINVDSTITLTKDGQTLAQGWGRDGGPRKIFQHDEVVRSAFDQSLDEFTAQLGRGAYESPSYR